MEQEKIARLVERIQNGDRQAFEEIYQETSKTVYFICISFLNNEEDAKDVMQDTYITAYQKLEQLQEKEKFTAWISQIAVNKCKKLLLKNSPMLMEPESMTNMATENNESFLPEEYITQKSKRKIVMDIMRKKLSDIQYQTVILFYFNDLSIEEIADVMECPPGTVKYRLSVSRAKIKEGVLEYENESKDKLYSFAPIPFLAGLLAMEAENIKAPDIWADIAQSLDILHGGVVAGAAHTVEQKVADGVARNAATEAQKVVAQSAKDTVVGKVAKKAAKDMMKGSGLTMGSMKLKIIIAILCVVLLGGGLTAIIVTVANEAAEEKEMQEFIALMEEIESEKEQESIEASQEEMSTENDEGTNAETENAYEEDLELEYESLAGKIEEADYYFGASNLLLLSENKLYYGENEILTLEGGVKEFWAYSSIECGDMIAVVNQSGSLSLWECGKMYITPEPELKFSGLAFDSSKEFILDIYSDTVDILRIEGGNTASITTYHINDDKTLEYSETVYVEGYEDWSEEAGEFLDIPVKELLALPNPDRMGGYSMFGITDNNDLYEITQYGKTCEMEYVAGNIEQAYCSYAVLYTTDPIYSTLGDNTKLYSKVTGNSMGDSTDDPELAFLMPEGHTTDEVVNIFGDIDKLCVFEFSNGDVYYIDEVINEDIGGEYAMIKCEKLSELNSQGHILEMGMPFTSGNPKVYVLMDDYSVYSMEFEDKDAPQWNF